MLVLDGVCHRNGGSVGDKSPKSKQRDQKQKDANKQQDAAKAKAKQNQQAAQAPAKGKK
jgi:hypothetical protein